MLWSIMYYFASVVAIASFHQKESLPNPPVDKITIELRLRPDQLKDSGTITFTTANYILTPKSIEQKKRPVNGTVKLDLSFTEPGYINFYDLLKKKNDIKGYYFSEPGDEVVITADGNSLQFSGPASDKYRFQYLLDSIKYNTPKPHNIRGEEGYYLDSIGEYYKWEEYLQKRYQASLSLFKAYKGKMSDYAYGVIKDYCIRYLIKDLGLKFMFLSEKIKNNETVSAERLVQIYDLNFSVVTEAWARQAENRKKAELPLLGNRIKRTYDFDTSLVPSLRKLGIYSYRRAVEVYTGDERENYIVNSLPRLMQKTGFTEDIEEMLRNYYAEPGYPEYKTYVREKEAEARRIYLRHRLPEFTLLDKEGQFFTKDRLKNKFAVLYFWRSDVPESKQLMARLMDMEKRLKRSDKLVFVYISVDSSKQQWLTAIHGTKNPQALHVYTGGQGAANEMMHKYAVSKYPLIWLVHANGGVMNASRPAIDLTKNNGRELEELLMKQFIALPNDGPYVWHSSDRMATWHIKDSLVSTKEFTNAKAVTLSVQSDIDHTFPVKLQPALTVQPVEYARPEKLLAFSDIEGNFDALRKLLQYNGVMDEQYNWKFGTGHLVFSGDMFDRGNQVTECLWLMYSLEEKAKAAGGHVHFILGNHEIMNMQGNHKYVVNKYQKNVQLMGKTLADLYNEDSELGRWLRTKHVMEKIGDLLFVHAGISHDVWRMDLNLQQMNDLVRTWYGKKIDSTNKNLVILYGANKTGPLHSRLSPFWFRGYYGDADNDQEIPSMKQVDSTLQKFKVNRIVTGHTIVADTISVHYEGKIINTDTDHARRKSEALLIEGDHFYRVNADGKKILLFIDEKRKKPAMQ